MSGSGGDDVSARAVASAVGSVLAELTTLPTDVVKVRLQVQQSVPSTSSCSSSAGGAAGAGAGAPVRYAGFVDCLMQTARSEGPLALWKGLVPALVRQVLYTSSSLVIYEPIRDFYQRTLVVPGSCSSVGPTYAQRLLAGGTAGALAISVFNPTEVVKTQVQSHREGTLRVMDVVKRVWAKDGLLGFWAGVKPNVTRTFLVNAAELGTYDEAKSRFVPYFGDGLASHVGASGCAGFASACISTPADVVKTRLMNSAGGAKQYSGMFQAGARILSDEGPAALYKGFLPICVRKLIWCTVFFVSYERVRALANGRTVAASG